MINSYIFKFQLNGSKGKLCLAVLLLNIFLIQTNSLYSQSQDTLDKSISFTQSSQTAEAEQGSSQTLLDYIATTDNVPVNAHLTAVDGSNNTPSWLSVNGNLLT